MPICFRLFLHCDRRAASRACCTAGSSRATRTAMIAITTSSSINVKPRRRMGHLPWKKDKKRGEQTRKTTSKIPSSENTAGVEYERLYSPGFVFECQQIDATPLIFIATG